MAGHDMRSKNSRNNQSHTMADGFTYKKRQAAALHLGVLGFSSSSFSAPLGRNLVLCFSFGLDACLGRAMRLQSLQVVQANTALCISREGVHPKLINDDGRGMCTSRKKC